MQILAWYTQKVLDADSTREKLAERLEKVRRYVDSDPENALTEARRAAELVCKYLLLQHSDPTVSLSVATLEQLRQRLRDSGRDLPPVIDRHLENIRWYGNFGSHDQFDKLHPPRWNAKTGAHACLAILEELLSWFFTEYLGVPKPISTEHLSGLFSLAEGRMVENEHPEAQSSMRSPLPSGLSGASNATRVLGNLPAVPRHGRNQTDTLIALAESLIRDGDVEAGVGTLEKVARSLEAQSRPDEYVRVCERIAYFQPGNAEANYGLVVAYEQCGDRRRMLRTLTRWYQEDQIDPRLLRRVAQVLEEAHDLTNAAQVWEKYASVCDGNNDLAEAAFARIRGKTLRSNIGN
jgi:hypothetical protein